MTKDDIKQYQEAFWLFENALIYIPVTIILETEWVLRYAYDFAPTEIAGALRKLFGLRNVDLEKPLQVDVALNWYEQGLDFADALHVAIMDRNGRFVTFDQKLIKVAEQVSDKQVTAIR
ncbi:MAG TPA: type II toxin-antitoxin system VapC family toxin [Anaerolineae bacterium]|nr:type II toxin-antitoxin system VapC family toxin [Anaerolineae bacterium]